MSVKKMKNQWLIAILLLIVCLALSAWLFFSGKKQPNTEKSEEAHAEGEAGHE
ncbi:efflux transporter periplasmic adaptor subunit, partial [Acinetobacter baumannii]